MKKLSIGIVAGWTLLVCAVARAEDPVTINKNQPSVVVRSFDAKHPPKEMPPLKGDEAAVTNSSFQCEVQVEVETATINGKPQSAKVAGMRATLRLDVTEWLPTGVTKKIKAHEDGHRKISERVYENAERTAGELAQKYIGKSVDVNADAQKSAEAIKKIAHAYCEEYLGAIEVPSEKVQQAFDRITDHGRNKVPEDTSIRRAFDEQRKD